MIIVSIFHHTCIHVSVRVGQCMHMRVTACISVYMYLCSSRECHAVPRENYRAVHFCLPNLYVLHVGTIFAVADPGGGRGGGGGGGGGRRLIKYS